MRRSKDSRQSPEKSAGNPNFDPTPTQGSLKLSATFLETRCGRPAFTQGSLKLTLFFIKGQTQMAPSEGLDSRFLEIVGVELVGERGVVAGFGEVGPRRRIRGEEGIAGLGSDASAEEERVDSHRGVHAAANRRGGR